MFSFYHSDHLGSAAYLTDASGHWTQALNYLPYGEDWVERNRFSDPADTTRLGVYRFNGKEMDYESGFHYYGARYYWGELLTGWLSVDPMMDKYPGMSPYNYCMWNPVKLIDPDGRDTTVGINLETGNVNYHATDESLNGSVVEIYNGSQLVSSHSLQGEINSPQFGLATNLTFSDYSDAFGVYSSLIGNNDSKVESSVEWNYYKQLDGSAGLVTSQKSNSVDLSGLGEQYSRETTELWRHFHPKIPNHAWYVPSKADQQYAIDMGLIPCYLDFNGQSYRFDDAVRKNGVQSISKFRIPLNINKY